MFPHQGLTLSNGRVISRISNAGWSCGHDNCPHKKTGHPSFTEALMVGFHGCCSIEDLAKTFPINGTVTLDDCMRAEEEAVIKGVQAAILGHFLRLEYFFSGDLLRGEIVYLTVLQEMITADCRLWYVIQDAICMNRILLEGIPKSEV